MKLTGKITDLGLKAFTKKPPLRAGRKIPRIWVIVADKSIVRIFTKPDGHLELIGEALPDKTMQTELTNKTIGRVAASGSGRHHKYEPHMEQSWQDEFAFVRNVADWLAWIKHLQAQGRSTSLLLGSVNLLLGSFIVAFHWVWEGIALIVTIFGVLFLLRSVVLLFCPSFLPQILKKLAPRMGGLVTVSGLVITGIAVLLLYYLYGPASQL